MTSAEPSCRLRMPAEWAPHRATWISWPHYELDWPGKLAAVTWTYAEIVRVLAGAELVEVLCHSEAVRGEAAARIAAHGVEASRVRLHVVPTNRSWLRDSAPTVLDDGAGGLVLANWGFSAWAKYDNFQLDAAVGAAMADITGLARIEPMRPDGRGRLVLEGGGIETNGDGLVLVTEEWLLSEQQVRNPGLGRDDYDAAFREWLGARRTIWLGEGCVGDDTHGHVDDIARFVAPDTIVLAVEDDPADDNYGRSQDNVRRLELAMRDPAVGPLRVVKVPYPRPVLMAGERLPASYANFYLANGLVVVPTFNDRQDRVALETIAAACPGREAIGLHAVDLVWGLGTLHCLTQQEPLGGRG